MNPALNGHAYMGFDISVCREQVAMYDVIQGPFKTIFNVLHVARFTERHWQFVFLAKLFPSFAYAVGIGL